MTALRTLGTVSVSVADTQVTTPLTALNELEGLSAAMRFAGTGGTSVDVYLQQSHDSGGSWSDLCNGHFTASGVKLFSFVQGPAENVAVTDGAIASDQALNEGIVPLFDEFRLKVVSVGTWVSGLVSVTIMPRNG
jgi:hypothetical protein